MPRTFFAQGDEVRFRAFPDEEIEERKRLIAEAQTAGAEGDAQRHQLEELLLGLAGTMKILTVVEDEWKDGEPGSVFVKGEDWTITACVSSEILKPVEPAS